MGRDKWKNYSMERKRKKTLNMKDDEKLCTRCEKIFAIKTHFKSSTVHETKTCILCRYKKNEKAANINSTYQKRKATYLKLKQNKIIKKNGCQWTNCYEINPDIIEFDHIDPKEKKFQISRWVTKHSDDENVLVNEMNKCRLLCKFHHRIHSETQRKKKEYSNYPISQGNKYREQNKIKLLQKKLEIGECSECCRKVTEKETQGFDFDHLDTYPKFRAIASMVDEKYSWNKSILPEIEKCRLICANCHVKHTKIQRVTRKEENYEVPQKISKLKRRKLMKE